MKKMPWKKTLTMSGIAVFCFAAGAFAANTAQKVEAYLRPDFSVVLNGSKVNLGQAPLVYDGNGYLPIRAVANLLGVAIDWEESSKSILISLPESPAQSPAPNAGNVPASPSTDQYTVETEIKLSSLVAYKMTYLNADYPVLANFYDNNMYLRLSDVQRMGISTTGLTLSKEKLTGEYYVHVELLKPRWKEMPLTNLLNGPVITGETNTEKIKALKQFVPAGYNPEHAGEQTTVYSIQALPEENTYLYLCQQSNREFVGYKVKLGQTSSGGWNVYSGSSIRYIDSEE